METNTVHQINEKYYNNLYRERSRFLSIIHPLVSYDQQSKSRANYAIVKKYVRQNSNVLDYGFGHGSFLLKFPKSCSLFGVDISVEAVNNFPKTAKFFGRTARTSTPENISKIAAPQSLDLIGLSHVLEHVDDDRELLIFLRGFLKADGHLLINVPINEVWKDPKHIRAYDIEKVNQLLQNTGFIGVEHLMIDKTTAFLLDHEQNQKGNFLKRIALRGFRLLLGLSPFSVYRMLDTNFFKNYPFQQLIVLAKKA